MTGKEKCYELKRLREELAKKHGIEGFEFEECNFDGECKGYCPACDKEALELEKLIKEKTETKEVNIKTNKTIKEKTNHKELARRGIVLSMPNPKLREEKGGIGASEKSPLTKKQKEEIRKRIELIKTYEEKRKKEDEEYKKNLPTRKVKVGEEIFCGKYDAEKEIVILEDGRIVYLKNSQNTPTSTQSVGGG